MKGILLFLMFVVMMSSFVVAQDPAIFDYELLCNYGGYSGELSNPNYMKLNSYDTPTVDRERDLCDFR